MKSLSSLKIIAAFILCQQCFAQEVIKTFDAPFGDFNKVNGIVKGDSLLFQFPDIGQAGWLKKDGRISSVDLKILAPGKVDEIIQSGDTTTYYSFNFAKQYFEVSGLNATSRGVQLFPRFRFNGIFLGHYTDTKKLILVYADKTNKIIKVASLKRESVSTEKEFQLAFDLLKEKNLSTAIITNGKTPTPFEASATIKIYPFENTLTILKDEPFEEYNETRRRYQTILVELDLATNQSRSRFYLTPHQKHFTSVLFNNVLFRSINKDGLYIEAIDVGSGKSKYSIAIPYKPNFAQPHTYYRGGKKNTVVKFKDLRAFGGENSFIIPHHSTDSTYLITLGSYFEIDPHTPLTGAFGLAGAIASLAINAIVSNAVDGPIDVYKFYVSGRVNSASQIPTETGLASQQVDEHELSWPKEKRVKGKAYFHGQDITFAFYQFPNGKVDVALFKHAQN